MSKKLPDIPGYDVEAEIGRGGMGVVYRVRQHSSGRVLALKMLLQGRHASFLELVRFRIEIEALACLDHPNIVKIRHVGIYSGYPYFALDYAERGSLKKAIAGSPQQPRWSAELVRTLALAVQHAHARSMLHRDLKPANILLTQDGVPKISDFGLVKFSDPMREVRDSCCTMSEGSMLDAELVRLARELSAPYAAVTDESSMSEEQLTKDVWEQCATRTGLLADHAKIRSVQAFLSDARQQAKGRDPLDLDSPTEAGAVLGTPSYMAPEQAAGNLQQIGPGTDIYALGGILYELITGKPPFYGGSSFDLLKKLLTDPPLSPRQVVPNVSRDIEAVCMKCLEKAPEMRYTSAAALVEDLSRFLDGYSPLAVKIDAAAPLTTATDSRQEIPSPTLPTLGTQEEQASVTKTWWPIGRKRSKAN